MRWMLTVEPEPGELRDLARELKWPDSCGAPAFAELLGSGRGRGRKHHGTVWSWYRVEDDMRELSARFPSLLFVLEVHNVDEAGLYPPERWFFKACDHYKSIGRIVFDDFDPAKLA
jgi:hypothetical protein